MKTSKINKKKNIIELSAVSCAEILGSSCLDDSSISFGLLGAARATASCLDENINSFGILGNARATAWVLDENIIANSSSNTINVVGNSEMLIGTDTGVLGGPRSTAWVLDGNIWANSLSQDANIPRKHEYGHIHSEGAASNARVYACLSQAAVSHNKSRKGKGGRRGGKSMPDSLDNKLIDHYQKRHHQSWEMWTTLARLRMQMKNIRPSVQLQLQLQNQHQIQVHNPFKAMSKQHMARSPLLCRRGMSWHRAQSITVTQQQQQLQLTFGVGADVNEMDKDKDRDNNKDTKNRDISKIAECRFVTHIISTADASGQRSKLKAMQQQQEQQRRGYSPTQTCTYWSRAASSRDLHRRLVPVQSAATTAAATATTYTYSRIENCDDSD
jgi:hypothetical protein